MRRTYHAVVLRRRLIPVLLAAAALVAAAPAVAGSGGGVDIVVVDGTLDGRMTDFIIGAIEGSDADVIVVQLDSAATLNGDLDALLDTVNASPTPIAVYAGPDPARVAGGAVQLLASADVVGAAPGVILGPAAPSRAGGTDDGGAIRSAHPDLPDEVVTGSVEVEDDLDGFIDLVTPSIGQFVVGLDGIAVGDVVLETGVEEEIDGVIRTVPSVPITFVEPGIVDRTIRVGATPEAAFFFLVAGLALAAFEFYAAGPGLAAAVAAICLLLGGYGVAVLPVRWWAVALVPVGLLLYTFDFQRNDLGWKSLLGTAALFAGGFWFTDAAPQIEQSWWVVGLVVAFAALWFGFALTTVVRARFSTQTIGRDHLIGRHGTAATAIAPDGVVVVDEARWQARSSRASGIVAGDTIEITAVDGIVLEVESVRD
jgi:membrane-bound serine protease (ClpP class)